MSIHDKQEKIFESSSSTSIFTSKHSAHMITALQDSIFIETFDNEYDAINYSDYRQILEGRMKK